MEFWGLLFLMFFASAAMVQAQKQGQDWGKVLLHPILRHVLWR